MEKQMEKQGTELEMHIEQADQISKEIIDRLNAEQKREFVNRIVSNILEHHAEKLVQTKQDHEYEIKELEIFRKNLLVGAVE